MSFTYDSAQLSESINRLRFLVQDTTETGRFFEDEELTFAAAEEGNLYRVAANLCRAIAAKLAKTPSLDNQTSILKFDAEERVLSYLKLAEKYDAKADKVAANVGLTAADLGALPTRDPAFTRDLHLRSQH